jgi:hypothetical protein
MAPGTSVARAALSVSAHSMCLRQSFISLNQSYHSEEAEVLAHLDFIWVVPFSHMGQNTGNLHKGSWFYSVLPGILRYSTCHFSIPFIKFFVEELFMFIMYMQYP